MNLITSIIAAVCIAIGTGLGWQLQAGRINTITQELKNEQLDRANERLAIQLAARDAIVKTTGQVKQAQVDAAARNDRLAADLRRTAGQLDSLRIASDTAVRNASAGVDACTGAVRTYNVIFSQCAGQLSEVAGDADKWSSHALMFQDAWPR